MLLCRSILGEDQPIGTPPQPSPTGGWSLSGEGFGEFKMGMGFGSVRWEAALRFGGDRFVGKIRVLWLPIHSICLN